MTPSWERATTLVALVAAHLGTGFTEAPAQPVPVPVPAPVRVAWAALGVDLRLSVERFEVRGRTLPHARNDLGQKGPRAEDGSPRHALTTYDITAQWAVESTPGRCRVAETSVGAAIRILLPWWSGAANAYERDYQGWWTLERDLTEHEIAHRDLALATAHRLAARLGTFEAATCSGLDHRVRAVIAKFNDALRRAQEDLDRDPRRPNQARIRHRPPGGAAH